MEWSWRRKRESGKLSSHKPKEAKGKGPAGRTRSDSENAFSYQHPHQHPHLICFLQSQLPQAAAEVVKGLVPVLPHRIANRHTIHNPINPNPNQSQLQLVTP
jgi:hypothetical protein